MCFQNILLLAYQPEAVEAVLDRVVNIAEAGHAAVSVVARVDTAGPGPGATTLSVEQLERVAETFRQRGITTTSRIVSGDLVPGVVSQAENNGHDLLVIPITAPTLAKGKPLASDILQLMRESPCPVWVMRPTQAEHTGIMVAVNPGSPEDKDSVVSRSLVELALCVCRLEGDGLSIVHIWHLLGEPQIERPIVGAGPEQITRLMGHAYSRAAKGMKRFLDTVDLESVRHKLHLIEEHRPSKAIAEFAARNRVELVVMGMMARSGLARLLIGNSAEEVFLEIDCSILTLRSDRSFLP